jgi:hypothetical protein
MPIITNFRPPDFGAADFAASADGAAGFSVAGAPGVSAGRRLVSSAT